MMILGKLASRAISKCSASRVVRTLEKLRYMVLEVALSRGRQESRLAQRGNAGADAPPIDETRHGLERMMGIFLGIGKRDSLLSCLNNTIESYGKAQHVRSSLLPCRELT